MIILSSLLVGAAVQKSPFIRVGPTEPAYLTAPSSSVRMRMAQDGDRIGILTNAGGGISFSYSTDLGRTISKPAKIVTGSGATIPHNMHIAMGGGKIWISYRRGSKLYIIDSNGTSAFSKETLVASNVSSTVGEEQMYEQRHQWIGYADGGLVVAYPSEGPVNVRAGRLVYSSPKGLTRTNPKVSFKTPPFSLSTIPLLKDPFSVNSVRVYTEGRTARVMIAKNIDPRVIVGMSRSRDGGRTWDVLPWTQDALDNHITYLGYQERGDNIRFKGIGTVTIGGDYELILDPRANREWLLIKGDNPTWGVAAWQVVTSKDLTKGMFEGPAVVMGNWRESVDLRGRPEPRTGERELAPVQAGKPSLITSRGMNEIFWCQGYLLSRGPGTAWQSQFGEADMTARYVGETTPVWKKYYTPTWDRAESYRRTQNVRLAFLTSMRSFVFGPEVVHVGTIKHPTRSGAFQTVYKPSITSDWVPLVPGEESGQIGWMDCASQGNKGFLVWVTNDRVCMRTLEVRL